LRPNRETLMSGFEAKPHPVLRPNREKPLTLVLRLN
jgi:hypothetical protein